MPTYTGEVVEVEILKRACGHEGEFACYRVDPYRAERRAKFQGKRCRSCSEAAVRELEERQRRERPSGSGKVKKGQEVKMLPADSLLSIIRRADGSWYGFLSADGVRVDGQMGGAMGLLSKLARTWLKERGAKLQGKV